jgi:hypothetical protein
MFFPNPTKGKLTVSLGTTDCKNALVEVASMDGKIIYNNTFNYLSTETIDLKDNQKGIYLINLSID